jgi:hypothetical protein
LFIEHVQNYKFIKTSVKINLNIYKQVGFYKQTTLLEDFSNQTQMYTSIFEKNIKSTNSKESYNYNNQILFFVGLMPIFLVLVLFILIINTQQIKTFNKKHCLQINI